MTKFIKSYVGYGVDGFSGGFAIWVEDREESMEDAIMGKIIVEGQGFMLDMATVRFLKGPCMVLLDTELAVTATLVVMALLLLGYGSGGRGIWKCI